MTAATEYADRKAPAADSPTPDAPPRRGRALIGLTLAAALAASAVLQQTAYSYRTAALAPHKGTPAAAHAARRDGSNSRLANLDSFSLALMLGGLRGPLVMYLWTSSETQKSDKDLESFDTKVELIRLLQPEYVTVHLFQIWNKIYNISAQLASLSNKYAAIMDGLDYAQRTLDILPDDINIVQAIGSAYADKLGGSTEKAYYIPRVRNETLPVYRITFPAARLDEFKKAIADSGVDALKVRIKGTGASETALVDKLPGDRILAHFTGPDVKTEAVTRQSLRVTTNGRRTEMDTMLDVRGNILPDLLKPTVALPPGAEGNNGAELQYLAQFQPYPYGLSPIALGYNYEKRAQLLQRVGLQKHVQLSAQVIDHQPALTLKFWADEEWDRARRAEKAALGDTAPAADRPRELWTARAAPDARVVDRDALGRAIFSYHRASVLAAAALPELNEHLKRFPRDIQSLQSHIETDKAAEHLMRADAAYLQAMLAKTPEARNALLKKAKPDYEAAAKSYLVLIMKYYTDPSDAAAAKYSRDDISSDMTLAQLQEAQARLNAHLKTRYKDPSMNPAAADLQEYSQYLERIDDRVGQIK